MTDRTKDGVNKKYETILTNEEWLKIIKNKLQTTDFKILKKSIGPLSEEQVGFMGDHLKMHALVELDEGKGKESSKHVDLNFFAKSVPIGNEAFKEYVDGTQSFNKEYSFFSSLLFDLKKYLVQDEDVKNSSGNWACECFLTRPDIVVLENLINQGYQLYNYRTLMDYNHCIIVLQTLARFHAASVVFEEKQPRTSCGKVRKLTDNYPDIFFETEWVTTEGHPGNELLVSTIKAGLNLLEYLPNYKEKSEEFKTVRDKLPETLMELCEFVKPSERFRNVLNHGDLWTSNIFFRYGKESKPVEARFVDFQLFRYAPPACDLMSFLHLVTSRQFRESNLDKFLTAYYETLASELRRHNLDPDQLQLSWSEFKESCDYYKRGGQVTAAVYMQHIIIKGENLKTIFSQPEEMHMFMRVDKTKYVIDNFLSDKFYREQNTEVIQELIEQCILNV